ncbi:NAD-binding protein [Schizopora paradoxa]|uniref:NAD-binding protein n=1 Tax=Schizopora paradoxa TaxID=27342 RepID=A0A0H2RR59_9AGAM|nr:NAD-binding protein [Schizopora paradoxa]
MSAIKHQNVLVLGATGSTGTWVVDGLLESKKYHIIAGVRPSSLSKPAVSKLRERGVEIRSADVSMDDITKLQAAFQGVDTVIVTLIFTEIDTQPKLADAAKLAGVRRFITDDWGTACVPGVMKLYDKKFQIREYVKSIGLGYTFIDVGYWMSLLVPVERREHSEYPDVDFIPSNSYAIFGSGDVRTAAIARSDIGKFVAEIINDERTLNRYVFCWGDEKSQNEIWEIARKVEAELGKEMDIGPKRVVEKAEIEEKSKSADPITALGHEYMNSFFIRGDNTVENAKKPEYGSALDARELYPHLKVLSLEEFTRQLYSNLY